MRHRQPDHEEYGNEASQFRRPGCIDARNGSSGATASLLFRVVRNSFESSDMPLHTGRSLIWVSLESGGLSILSLIVLFVIARILGPADLGMAALAIGVVQMLAMLVDTLLHDAIVQRPDLHDDHLQTAFWTCLGLGCVSSAAVWMFAPMLGRLFDSPGLPPLLGVAGLSLVFTGGGSVAVAILRRHFAFKELALRTLYGRLGGAIAAIALALCGYGVWALIAQFLVQAAVNTVLVWRSTSWRPAFVFSGPRLAELLRFGMLSLGSRLAALSTARLFTVLVGYFLGVTAVGYVSIAQRLVDTLYDVLSGAAYNLALPIFSRRQIDRAALLRTYSRAIDLAALAVEPIFAGVAICAPGIVAVFLGKAWAPAVPLLQVIAAGAMVQFLLLFGEVTVNAAGHPRYVFAYAAASLGFVLGAFLLFPPADIFHAGLIWGMRAAVAAPLLLTSMHYLLGPKATVNLLRASFAPLVGIVAMTGIIAAVNAHVLSGSPPLYALLVQIPLGAAVYGAAVALTNRCSVEQFFILIASGIGRVTIQTPQSPPMGKLVPERTEPQSGATLL
jgi:O-antigen/teichoic acid export membrane protein